MSNRDIRDYLHLGVIFVILLVFSIFLPWWMQLLMYGWYLIYAWQRFVVRHRNLRPFRWKNPLDETARQQIEASHSALTEAQKLEAKESEPYQESEKALAIAILKRQLEFQEYQYRQVHNSEWVSIKTERVGRGLTIGWRLADDTPSNFSLLGLRKTGGFSNDYRVLDSNGTLVLESQTDGEVSELLKSGETYYYTFLLRGPSLLGPIIYFASRFQITMIAEEETAAIERTIRRVQNKEEEPQKQDAPSVRQPDPARENISHVVNELGLVFEFHNAMDAMEQSLISDIKKKNLPKEEEDEKIEFVRDTIRLQREKYQP
jgi:hypothetical protein